MRLTPIVLCLGLAASTVPTMLIGQRPDDQIAPLSVSLQKQGETLLAAGKLVEADDALESALAADPKNRTVFVTMAKVAIKQGLFGQAVHLTNKALALEPTDRNALLVQGEAMVEMGAAPRARENLAKIQKLCGTAACPQAIQLGATISRGPQMASATKKSAEEPKKN